MKRLLVLLAVLAAPAFASDITRESVVAAMNEQRARMTLPPLREDARLEAAAEDRMRDMEDQGYWAHEAPDGRSPFFWLRPRGYFFRAAGENLATGYESMELLIAGWMESEGHRANILSADYADCGVAVIDGGTTRRAAGRSVVVLFGSASPLIAPATRTNSRP
jgi:uncharacterized protein YkwD